MAVGDGVFHRGVPSFLPCRLGPFPIFLFSFFLFVCVEGFVGSPASVRFPKRLLGGVNRLLPQLRAHEEQRHAPTISCLDSPVQKEDSNEADSVVTRILSVIQQISESLGKSNSLDAARLTFDADGVGPSLLLRLLGDGVEVFTQEETEGLHHSAPFPLSVGIFVEILDSFSEVETEGEGKGFLREALKICGFFPQEVKWWVAKKTLTTLTHRGISPCPQSLERLLGIAESIETRDSREEAVQIICRGVEREGWVVGQAGFVGLVDLVTGLGRCGNAGGLAVRVLEVGKRLRLELRADCLVRLFSLFGKRDKGKSADWEGEGASRVIEGIDADEVIDKKRLIEVLRECRRSAEEEQEEEGSRGERILSEVVENSSSVPVSVRDVLREWIGGQILKSRKLKASEEVLCALLVEEVLVLERERQRATKGGRVEREKALQAGFRVFHVLLEMKKLKSPEASLAVLPSEALTPLRRALEFLSSSEFLREKASDSFNLSILRGFALKTAKRLRQAAIREGREGLDGVSALSLWTVLLQSSLNIGENEVEPMRASARRGTEVVPPGKIAEEIRGLFSEAEFLRKEALADGMRLSDSQLRLLVSSRMRAARVLGVLHSRSAISRNSLELPVVCREVFRLLRQVDSLWERGEAEEGPEAHAAALAVLIRSIRGGERELRDAAYQRRVPESRLTEQAADIQKLKTAVRDRLLRTLERLERGTVSVSVSTETFPPAWGSTQPFSLTVLLLRALINAAAFVPLPLEREPDPVLVGGASKGILIPPPRSPPGLVASLSGTVLPESDAVAQQALSVYLELRARRVSLPSSVLSEFVVFWAHSSSTVAALRQTLTEALQKGVRLEMKAYEAAVGTFCRAGDVKDFKSARDLLRSLPRVGVSPPSSLVRLVIRAYLDMPSQLSDRKPLLDEGTEDEEQRGENSFKLSLWERVQMAFEVVADAQRVMGPEATAGLSADVIMALVQAPGPVRNWGTFVETYAIMKRVGVKPNAQALDILTLAAARQAPRDILKSLKAVAGEYEREGIPKAKGYFEAALSGLAKVSRGPGPWSRKGAVRLRVLKLLDEMRTAEVPLSTPEMVVSVCECIGTSVTTEAADLLLEIGGDLRAPSADASKEERDAWVRLQVALLQLCSWPRPARTTGAQKVFARLNSQLISWKAQIPSSAIDAWLMCLASGYGSVSSENVFREYRGFLKRGFTPTPLTLSALARSCALDALPDRENAVRAWGLFDEAHAWNMTVSVGVSLRIMQACANRRPWSDWPAALSVFEWLTSQDIHKSSVYGMAIEALSRARRDAAGVELPLAWKLFQEMLDRGLPVNELTYEALLACVTRLSPRLEPRSPFESAFRLIEVVQEAGLRVTGKMQMLLFELCGDACESACQYRAELEEQLIPSERQRPVYPWYSLTSTQRLHLSPKLTNELVGRESDKEGLKKKSMIRERLEWVEGRAREAFNHARRMWEEVGDKTIEREDRQIRFLYGTLMAVLKVAGCSGLEDETEALEFGFEIVESLEKKADRAMEESNSKVRPEFRIRGLWPHARGLTLLILAAARHPDKRWWDQASAVLVKWHRQGCLASAIRWSMVKKAVEAAQTAVNLEGLDGTAPWDAERRGRLATLDGYVMKYRNAQIANEFFVDREFGGLKSPLPSPCVRAGNGEEGKGTSEEEAHINRLRTLL
uniref:Pentacotripeptide-repeat region of PRORP domain-containing protein n=1 Tax=Chromera velia CCMP2878 TaxID=1169474 RepID=A0A0G4GML7_9ALVE|eukprot:Cvel_4928.t1-p1 / transcript=Cvel_4928.t1 / gene=Cvel_4928 / organism=Chromera_velia_CCMP2878 / gene_product=hypothetical protein / transcript_product=hypothetical protein / location=Cvel_scaffold222:92165-101261(+) / protein_length=1676 / sequence_SO=supercontig / SO=protein_coding / is_pseudo=false